MKEVNNYTVIEKEKCYNYLAYTEIKMFGLIYLTMEV